MENKCPVCGRKLWNETNHKTGRTVKICYTCMSYAVIVREFESDEIVREISVSGNKCKAEKVMDGLSINLDRNKFGLEIICADNAEDVGNFLDIEIERIFKEN